MASHEILHELATEGKVPQKVSHCYDIDTTRDTTPDTTQYYKWQIIQAEPALRNVAPSKFYSLLVSLCLEILPPQALAFPEKRQALSKLMPAFTG
mmetsp:Transcript_14117/g.25194  ORF Transcript_14117/g.25194 Transcript_14117/m.25194 type:complete len:95 (+) Transcript_14117:296-580(+)